MYFKASLLLGKNIKPIFKGISITLHFMVVKLTRLYIAKVTRFFFLNVNSNLVTCYESCTVLSLVSCWFVLLVMNFTFFCTFIKLNCIMIVSAFNVYIFDIILIKLYMHARILTLCNSLQEVGQNNIIISSFFNDWLGVNFIRDEHYLPLL